MIEILVNHLGYAYDGPKTAILQTRNHPDSPVTRVFLRCEDNEDPPQELHAGAFATVPGWKDRWLSVIDFSHVRKPGRYRILLGDQVSEPVEIWQKPRLIEECLSDVLHYFRSQRCGGVYDKHDHACPVYGSDRKVDVRGGWYDASGDVSKYLSHLSYANYMNPQHTPMVVWNLLKGHDLLQHNTSFANYTRERIIAEALYGADFLVRMQDPAGYFYMIVFDVWSKDVSLREICSYSTQKGHKSDQYQAGMRQGGGMAVAALAAASRYGDGNDYSATDYLGAAEKGYWHLKEHNASYLDDGEENVIDAYCGLMAAVELWRATAGNKGKYLDESREWAQVLASYQGNDASHGTIWYADKAHHRPYFHAAEAGLPAIALMEYLSIESDPDRARSIRQVLAQSIRNELDLTELAGNPFGYPRQVVQDISGKRRLGFFFPHENESGYWWQGENARLASLATMAWLARTVVGNEQGLDPHRLNLYASRCIDWILGLNPFDACMLDGHGRNNPTYWPEAGYYNAKGGVCNGITSGFSDEQDVALKPVPQDTDPMQNWRWGEQWIPHAAWFFLAVVAGSIH